MDLLKDNLKKIYLRFLFSSLGSALVSSIYGLVDMAMVGQYQGPSGAAAMAKKASRFVRMGRSVAPPAPAQSSSDVTSC